MKPLGRINTVWNHRLAYATGLLATDGCLSKDGRHIRKIYSNKQGFYLSRKKLKIVKALAIVNKRL